MGEPTSAGPPPAQDVPELHSAGGVVVTGSGERLRVALMRSRYGTWVFPKGTVEKGEAPAEAARREIGEEIGLEKLATVRALGSTRHEFEREGRLLRKRVDWFLFTAPEGSDLRANPIEHSLEAGWFLPQEALRRLSHPDQRDLLREALIALTQ